MQIADGCLLIGSVFNLLMKKEPIGGDKNKVSVLIFTDLDGTLLDHTTYSWDKAEPALEICRIHNIPVIMVSSKTRAELDSLGREIGFTFPFISENGAGIFFHKDWPYKLPAGTILAGGMWKWSLGTPHNLLVKGLREIRDEGLNLRGFSDMTNEEISGLTNLDLESAGRAAAREFDEPFIVGEDNNIDIALLNAAAAKRGFRISRGGRFYHLHGKNDKGEAVKKVISLYKESHDELFTIALGDSPNDFPMLRQVDQPVLVKSQEEFPGIEKEIPGLIITTQAGPEGWNSAVKDILGSNYMGGIA
jgi:mannosyl-3-phosphoglycerate phosphatase